jgi:hypothetical protein
MTASRSGDERSSRATPLSAEGEMKIYKFVCSVLMFVGVIGLTFAAAHGQIVPVDANLVPKVNPAVTVSILDASGANITRLWLPEPNVPVTISVNGVANPVITLICPDGSDGPPCRPFTFPAGTNPFINKTSNPPVARTSAYPGVCTNVPAPPAVLPDAVYNGADFTLAGNILTPTDCGGMAVIRVTGTNTTGTNINELFILPQDTNANGIPDIWETVFCPGNTCPTGQEDLDAGPGAGLPNGDGLSTFDEYRGVMVSGVHIRTDPRQRDVFLHLVNMNNPAIATAQCAASSLLGGGLVAYPTPTAPAASITPSAASGSNVTFTTSAAIFTTAHIGGEIVATGANGGIVGRARITSVLNATTVAANVTALFASPPTTIPSGSWTLTESLFANLQTLVPAVAVHILSYAPGATNLFAREWIDNFLSLTPPQLLNVSDDISDRVVNVNRLYGPPQKGIRVIECLDQSSPSVLGWAFGVGSPNAVGNVIVYTQRIVTYISSLLAQGGTVQYSTFAGGVWTPPASAPGATSADVQNFIISKAIQFYLGMETGHSLDLTPTVMTSGKNTFGFHYAPGTGDCLDQSATNKFKNGVNTFYIPSSCGANDQSEFLAK